MHDTRMLVVARSHGRCEAMVRMPLTSTRVVYTRCFRKPIEVHHMLTRARGGKILDGTGETAHLIALCSQHHKVAHSAGGHQAGLMMDGYITTGPDGGVVYQGSDPRLSHLALGMPELREDVPGDHDGQGLRGQAR